MLEGEFESMKALHAAAPTLVPKPHAWGQVDVTEPTMYFFLCDFIELSDQNSDAVQLCSKLVALHKSTQSPNNLFGFHVNPLRGNLPLNTTWTASWKELFAQILRGTLASYQRVNGTRQGISQLVESVVEIVVAQVRDSCLEAEGRSIKPSLVHGGHFDATNSGTTELTAISDLWGGIIGTDARTGEVYFFDASSYYAHHEMEVAIWRYVPNTITGSGAYVEDYLA